MSAVQVKIPDKLLPIFEGDADVRGAYGGRGSAKTRSFAKMIAVRGYIFGRMGVKGQLVCGRQFMNSLEDSSLEECKRAIEDEPFLAEYYDVGDKYIKSRDGRIWFTFVGLDRNIASIKSKGRILILWVDEAEPVTDPAWTTVIPTLREEGEDWNAELWVTWNPRRKGAPVESRFRAVLDDPRIKLVEMNWRDNPMFPAKLERDRRRDLQYRPDQYPHIWEGEYAKALEGAYFAKQLAEAKAQGRIGRVSADPLLPVRAVFDLGGSGANADAMSIWIVQWVGKEIRVLDYIEGVGQVLAYYVTELRSKGWGKAICILPHDGVNENNLTGKKYEDHVREAGFEVIVVKNQGKGAAMMRIEAARRLFPQIWFNEDTTEAGRDALGYYHEKRDDARNLGLGPEHDWSSHGADAFGLMCVAYEPPEAVKAWKQQTTKWVV